MFPCNLLLATEKVLVQLNLTLVGKSDLYSDIYLRAVFRLNNNHYVLKALQRAGLLDLVRLSEPDCEESYHNMIREHKRAYSQRQVELLCSREAPKFDSWPRAWVSRQSFFCNFIQYLQTNAGIIP